MGVLNHESRPALLALLARLPVLATRAGRDLLLGDLPLSVVQGIERSDTTTMDLAAIVAAADSWWPTDAVVAEYPLQLLVQAATALAACRGERCPRL